MSSNASIISRLIQPGGDIISADETVLTGGTTTYATIADLPLSGNSAGDQAFVEGNDHLYLWTGSGWYNIALINTAPNITGAGAGSYSLAGDGTPTVITLTAEDPEGLSITWSYAVTAGSLGSTATVLQDDNVFTITPSTDTANAGTFELTFTASDGVNIATDVNSFTLAFVSALWDETALSIGTSSTNSLDNSTFIDRSSNAHSITANGDAMQTAFHPYLDNWSVEFDGTGDYLTVPNSASLSPESGDFTFELNFYYRGAYPSGYVNVFSYGFAGNALRLFLNTNTIMVWRGSTPVITSSANAYTTNAWQHVAIAREGSTLTLYIDGTSVGSATETATFDQGPLNIGQESGQPLFTGHISNLRIVKGTAVYTSDFTPPTEKLTAISGTSLLTCQSNRFIDTSSNGHTITVNGDAKVSAFNPFGQESEYAVGENKGSTLFDGSGDYVSASTSSTFAVGSGDWTIECWAYSDNNRATYGPGTLCDLRTAPVAESFAWRIQNNLGLRFANTAANTTFDTTTNVFKMGAWNHLAIVRDGSTLYQYVNGVQVGSTSTGYNWGTSGWPIRIGGNLTSGYEMDGHISDFRFVKGSAVYPNGTTFTPPIAPVGNTNASLYLPMDNAGIFDKTGVNTLTVIGDASTSTTQTKFADTSVYFDGNVDRVQKLGGINVNMSSFTIEGWINPSSWSSATTDAMFAFNRSSDGANVLLYTPKGLYYGAADYWTGTGLSANQWSHVAVTYDGTTIKAYENGTEVLSQSHTFTTNFSDCDFVLGSEFDSANGGTPGNYLTGYIENFQILSVVKYTANFTPPTSTQGRMYQAES